MAILDYHQVRLQSIAHYIHKYGLSFAKEYIVDYNSGFVADTISTTHLLLTPSMSHSTASTVQSRDDNAILIGSVVGGVVIFVLVIVIVLVLIGLCLVKNRSSSLERYLLIVVIIVKTD